jgi:hypothetical protein
VGVGQWWVVVGAGGQCEAIHSEFQSWLMENDAMGAARRMTMVATSKGQHANTMKGHTIISGPIPPLLLRVVRDGVPGRGAARRRKWPSRGSTKIVGDQYNTWDDAQATHCVWVPRFSSRPWRSMRPRTP